MALLSQLNYAQAEEVLEDLQKYDLSILRLAEPVSSINREAKRSSDTSTDAGDNPTPASFAADLSHYKVSCFQRVHITH